jgi:fumarate hydratase subunit alpha
MARVIDTSTLIPVLAALIQKACCELDDSLVNALKAALAKEESPYGKKVLETLIENAQYAKEAHLPCCQDTGTCIVVMEIGQEVSWTGAPLEDAVNAGVAKGYTEGYLRKSMADDPLYGRKNTGDNTPAVLHTSIVAGDRVTLTVLPKGGGSENMGAFATLTPAQGEAGVIDFVTGVVEKAGGNPCPPLVVGVGIGGTMDWSCWLAKKALLRPLGDPHPDPRYAALERILLERINALGIGPMGMGGRTTALAVHVEQSPCHITSLPVAVTLQCHANRVARAVV